MTRARDLADGIFEQATGGVLKLETSDTTVTDGSVLGKIEFKAPDEASGTDAILVGAAIEAVAEGTFAADNNATELVFKTGASAAATTKMTLTSGGNVGIGTSPDAANGGYLQFPNGYFAGQYGFGRNTYFDGSNYKAIYTGGATLIQGGDNFLFYTAASVDADANQTLVERMRIGSAGKITTRGTTSTGNGILEFGTININNNVSDGTVDFAQGLAFTDNATNEGAWTHAGICTTGSSGYNGNLVFGTDGSGSRTSNTITERMRLTNDGHLLVGRTANNWPAAAGITLQANGAIIASRADTSGFFNRLSSDGAAIHFLRAGTLVGSISVNGSSTAYNTSSDYRLKTDAQPMTGASARVLALNPVNFKWIADNTRVDGFLAHEAQVVVPECVNGTKDAMKDEEYQVSAATGDIYTAGSEAGFTEISAAIEASPAYYDVDGNIIRAEVIAKAAVHEAYDAVDEVIHSTNAEQPETLEDGQQWRETTPAVMGTRSVPDMQGIDQSKMVPLLVASLQEALARITVLESA